jgi:tetratricopeptide (TPR) repeat protein
VTKSPLPLVFTASRGGDGADLALALTQLSWQLYWLDELEKARAAAEEATAIWRELPASEADWSKDIAESFSALGAVLGNLGDEESARLAFERALQLRERYHEQLPDERRRKDPLIAAALLNMGTTFIDSAQWSEVKSFMERSVQAYRAAIKAGHHGGGRIGLMRALRYLARAQWELGERTESITDL